MKNRKTPPAADSFLKPENCIIIAEIGTSHAGDLIKAEDLAYAAAEAGADVFKTQIVIADEIIHPATGTVDLPGGPVPLYERFKALEKAEDFYLRLSEAAGKAGLLFLASPFGMKSLSILLTTDSAAVKIASPELNHFPLLRAAAASDLPVLLSTGVSTLGDIEKALTITGRGKSALLHCITSYPAPEDQYNILLMRHYAEIFGVPVGVSDHSLSAAEVPATAAAAGASFIEKHFTLSRQDGGLDDPVALTPEDFRTMCCAVREVEKAVKTGGMEEGIKTCELLIGTERVKAVLGDGVKRLAPAESANYLTTNRSVHALRNIKKGEVIGTGDMAVLRTEKVLRPGLHPEMLEIIKGRKAARDIESGQGIVWPDLAD